MTWRPIILIALGFWLGLLTRWWFDRQKPRPPEAVVSDTVLVTRTITDTVEIAVRDTVIVEKYVPVVVDDVAVMDTTLTIKQPPLKIVTDLHVEFSLKERLFRNMRLRFPTITYPVDTVYVERQVTVAEKPSVWKYVQAGVVGAGVGLTVYAIVRGM
jgi:hypothetical protein